VGKPEWGTKRTCLNCGVRFYDLGNKPITCPSCETSFEPEAFVKTRRSRQSAPEEPKKAAPETEAAKESEKAAPGAAGPDAEATSDDEVLGDDVDDEEDDTVLPVEADEDEDSDDVGGLIDKPGGTKEEG